MSRSVIESESRNEDPSTRVGVFHQGQIQMQQEADTRSYAARMEAYFSGKIDAGAREILHDAVIVYVATYDADDGATWITPLIKPENAAEPLVRVLRAQTVRVTAEMSLNDPLLSSLSVSGAWVGLTVMQEWTRDRIRLNGRIIRPLTVSVLKNENRRLSFEFTTSLSLGLCPKYIVDRRIICRRPTEPSTMISTESRSMSSPVELPSLAVRLITETDTFWLGTTELSWGSQSSHRGGAPGFLRLIPHSQQPPAHSSSVSPSSSSLPRLVWGDYQGNSFFHSLGSAISNPLVGITIVHYQSGHVLQMTGKLETVKAEEVGADLDGANRHCIFDILQWRLTLNAIPFVFHTVSRSMNTPALRDIRQQGADSSKAPDTEMTLINITSLSLGIKTFRLTPSDPSVQLRWLPAQYATLRVLIDGRDLERSWTITSVDSQDSNQPSSLEFTIKRDAAGVASRYLHDTALVGQKMRLVGIEGNFTLPSMYWTQSSEGITSVKGRALRRIWLSAGIGITPFLAHMRCLLRFHSLHYSAAIDVPSTNIIWLHTDYSMEHVAHIQEIAAFVHAEIPHLQISFLLALTRVEASRLNETQKRVYQLFPDESRAQLVIGRPSVNTIFQLAPTSRSSFLNDRSIDACSSVPVMAEFKQWIEEWKREGLNILKFRTESFAY